MIFTSGLSGCFYLNTYTNLIMAHVKIEKLDTAIACFVVKWNNAIKMTLSMAPPPIPATVHNVAIMETNMGSFWAKIASPIVCHYSFTWWNILCIKVYNNELHAKWGD